MEWISGGSSDVVDDTSPQLGGDLDGNSKSIYGVGVITATTFVGDLTGTATTASGLSGTPNITVGSGTFSSDVTMDEYISFTAGGTSWKSYIWGTNGTSGGLRFNAQNLFYVELKKYGGQRAFYPSSTEDVDLGNSAARWNNFYTKTINASAGVIAVDGTFSGNVSIAGTLTYEDVTNVDSVGLITARSGIKVTGGDLEVGSNVTISNGGIVTATTFSGDVTGTATTATNLADGANITTGIITAARLGSGVDSAKFLRGDGTWQTVSTGGAGGLWESNATGINTSTNIGIGTTNASLATLTVDVGSATTAVVVQGSEGQLFSVTNSLSSGSVFSVNDISGIPSIDVDADGTIQLAPFSNTEFIGIGTTNPGMKLHVFGDATITGVITSTDFNTTSDIRFKTNIQPIDDPINKIIQIEGVSFNWKSDNRPALGVIADQVEKILPQLVNGDNPKTVNYNGLVGLLIEAVKEQQTQIDDLKERLFKLE